MSGVPGYNEERRVPGCRPVLDPLHFKTAREIMSGSQR
jgi:hypothetical protein